MRSSVALLAATVAVAAFSVIAHALYRPVAAAPVASSMLGSVNVSEPFTPLVKAACGDDGLLVIYGAGGRPVVVLVYAQEGAGGLQGCAAKAATCLMTLGVPPAEAKRVEEALASQLAPRRAAVTTLAVTVSEATTATTTMITAKPVTHSVTTATAESRSVAAGEAGSEKTVSGVASAPRPGGGGASTTRHVSGSWGLRAGASLLAGAVAAAAVMLAWRRSL